LSLDDDNAQRQHTTTTTHKNAQRSTAMMRDIDERPRRSSWQWCANYVAWRRHGMMT